MAKQAKTKINKGREISRKGDAFKNVSVGLMDIDRAIFYYFENVIKPVIIENGEQVKVPVIYANPERWAALQRQGHIRDHKRKIMAPVVAFRRTGFARDETMPVDKLDPTSPKLHIHFEKQYSKENRYDKLSALKGITPKREIHAVSVPDYVSVTYEFIVWTNFTDHMNNIVEKINWSEGSYWGEPGKFRFRSSIESFEDASEYEGQRKIKTSFSLNLKGYLLPDEYPPTAVNTQKFITPKQIVINDNTDINITSLAGIDDEGAKTITVISNMGVAAGGSTGGSTYTAGTGLTLNSSDEFSITLNTVGNAHLEYDTGQHLTTTSSVQFGNISGSALGTFGSVFAATHITASGNISASGTIYADNFQSAGGDSAGISFTDDFVLTGNMTASGDMSGSGTGSFGLVEIDGKDINPTGVSRDQVLKFNGTNFVPAAYDDTFVFTISDFDMSHTTTPVLIGSGSWKAVGALQFTASYNNGPPDGYNGSAEGAAQIRGYVDGSVSSSYDMYPLSSSFTMGTNTMIITFPPDSTDDIRFRLYASAGSDTDNDYTDQRIYFYNQFVYGDLSANNGFTQANIRTLAADNTVTSNDTSRTLTVSIGSSNYLCFAHRTGDTNVAQVQCGSGNNILSVAMDRSDATTITPLKETVSYLNTAGYTENFYVYASKIANVDAHSTTFKTLTSTVKKNYFYWGYDAQADTYNESFIETAGSWDSHNANSSYDDGTVTGQTLSVGTFTSKYVIIAFPDRYGDNDSQFVFKDNGTGLPFDVTKQSDATITNAVGFQETYHVWRSTNALTMSNLTILIAAV